MDYIFLSTPSARRATEIYCKDHKDFKFLSTPSARRATIVPDGRGQVIDDFYPRPPRGGRPANSLSSSSFILISIHALREEGDSKSCRRRGSG